MRSLLLALLMLQLCGSSYSQPVDSVQRHIDSLNRRIHLIEDSLVRQRLFQTIQEKGQSAEQFLADFKKQQEKERRRTYIRIGVGALFMAALIYGILRKRKLQRKP